MPLTVSTRWRGGQLLSHSPPTRKGFALVGLQLRHCEADGPSHVRQSAEHASHVALASAYLPSGVHEAMQLSSFRAGVAPEQEVHTPLMAQVWQLRSESIAAHG